MTFECMTVCPQGHRGYLRLHTIDGTIGLACCPTCGRPARCWPLTPPR